MSVFNVFWNMASAEPLCRWCAYAHVERGFRGEEETFCNWGTPMRRLKFKVCECTGYLNCEAAKPSKISGFGRATQS